jgi:solute:Na+ symporter, SSS family
MGNVDLWVCGLMIFFLIGLGVYRGRPVSKESTYLLADRKTGLLAMTATLVMTEFNTSTLISFSSLGFSAGFWALWLPAIFLIGLFFYGVTVAKKWKAFNGLSVAAFFSERYGKDMGKMASSALLVAMVGFSATYVKSLWLIFQPLVPSLSPWIGTLCFTAIVLLMVWKGGLLAIIQTDLVSFWATLLLLPLLLFFAWVMPEHPAPLVEGREILPFSFISSLIVLTMFTYILAPWYGQKIFSAKSEREAYYSVLLAAVIVFVLYGVVVGTTALMRQKGGECPGGDSALGFFIHQFVPQGFRGAYYAILFSASATTLTGCWNAMTAMVVSDFLPQKEGTSRRSIAITCGFALSSFLLANLLVDQIFRQLILANIPVAALSFALLGGFYWKGANRAGAIASMIIGWSWGVGSYVYWGDAGGYTWYWAMLGIPMLFLGGIIASRLFAFRYVHH